MRSPGQEELFDAGVLAERASAEAGDRRRWRRALAGAAVAHLAVLAVPLPEGEVAAPGMEVETRVYELSEVRFAPPEPAPVAPEPAPVPVEPPPTEDEPAAPPGPPPPPRIEVLFPEGELSRLAPPRPLQAVPPPPPPDAPPEGGEARLYLQLDERGRVLSVRAAGGPEPLLAAAQSAAATWVFLPATLDAQPIPVVVEVVVRFPPTSAPPSAPSP